MWAGHLGCASRPSMKRGLCIVTNQYTAQSQPWGTVAYDRRWSPSNGRNGPWIGSDFDCWYPAVAPDTVLVRGNCARTCILMQCCIGYTAYDAISNSLMTNFSDLLTFTAPLLWNQAGIGASIIGEGIGRPFQCGRKVYLNPQLPSIFYSLQNFTSYPLTPY